MHTAQYIGSAQPIPSFAIFYVLNVNGRATDAQTKTNLIEFENMLTILGIVLLY